MIPFLVHGRVLPAFACLLLGVVLFGCGRQGANEAEEKAAITKLWGEYQAAKLARDGEKVVNCYSADTIKYYDQVVILAATGAKSDFEKAPLSMAFLALKARFDLGARALRDMKGRDLVAYNHSSPSVEPKAGPDLGSISLMGKRATAGVSASNTNKATWDFIKEASGWKINFAVGLVEADGRQEERRKKMGVASTELTKQDLERARNKKIPDSIWNPTP
jgi:ketosteroid isomerase-like protein